MWPNLKCKFDKPKIIFSFCFLFFCKDSFQNEMDQKKTKRKKNYVKINHFILIYLFYFDFFVNQLVVYFIFYYFQ
jgi:hypothetical protein